MQHVSTLGGRGDGRYEDELKQPLMGVRESELIVDVDAFRCEGCHSRDFTLYLDPLQPSLSESDL